MSLKKIKPKRTAFTLLESVAVVAVVGVLVVGILVFSKGIIDATKNFKNKFPGYSNLTNETEILTSMIWDGSNLDNIVPGSDRATNFKTVLDNGIIRLEDENGSCGQMNAVVTFDFPIDLSKNFSISVWANGMYHLSLADFTNPYEYSSAYNYNFRFQRWGDTYIVLTQGASTLLLTQHASPTGSVIQHQVVTYDAASRELTMYLQGVQKSTYVFGEGSQWNGTGYLRFDKESKVFAEFGCAILVDSAFIDNENVLSSTEVANLFSQGSP
jgi:hypothetical protein